MTKSLPIMLSANRRYELKVGDTCTMYNAKTLKKVKVVITFVKHSHAISYFQGSKGMFEYMFTHEVITGE